MTPPVKPHPETSDLPRWTDDFRLGFSLASASEAEIEEALADRPDVLARMLLIKALIDAIVRSKTEGETYPIGSSAHKSIREGDVR